MTRNATALTRDECVVRLSSRSIGRVSVSMDALPVIVPVIYTLDGDSVLFRAPLDPALASVCDGAVIAFEVDDFATSVATDGCWSVHVMGVGSLLGEHERLAMLRIGALNVNGPEVEQLVRLPVGNPRGYESQSRARASVGGRHTDPSGRMTGRGLRGPDSPRLARRLHGTP